MSEVIRIGGNAKGQLKAIVERVQKLDEEKKAISDDIKEVFAEAKSHGFDVKALRRVIREASQDKNERAELEAICDLYRDALGMGTLADTPLGEAAIAAATAAAQRVSERGERKQHAE